MTVSDAPVPFTARAQWWHLLLLVGVVTLIEGGRVASDGEFPLFSSLFIHSLYRWLPALCGIAISINQADARASRSALWVGLAGVASMTALDLWGVMLPPAAREAAFLLADASLAAMREAAQAASVSWVATAMEGMAGGIPGADQVSTDYSLQHPRFRAVEAMADGAAVLLVFASIGFVIAANSWIRAHVVFAKPQDRRASQIVVAWLITPLLTAVATDLTSDQRFHVLFRGGALWRPAVPSLVLLLVSLGAWRLTARYRERAGHEE